MVQRILQQIGVVLLAILGSIVLVVLLANITTMLTILNRTAADFLPADHTIALVQNPGDAELTMLREWFPDFTPQENTVMPKAIAILELPIAGRAFVQLYLPEDIPESTKNRTTVGTYAVVTSQEALPFIGQGESRLTNDSTYRTLQEGKSREDAWAFFRSSALPKPQELSSQFVHAFLTQQCSALAMRLYSNGGRTLELLTKKKSLSKNSILPPAPEKDTVFTLGTTNMYDIWSTTLQGMETGAQAVLQGVVQHILKKGFGPSVSADYDILPLLQKGSTVTINRTGSGRLIGLLHGFTEDASQLNKAVERMHLGIRTKLPTMHIQTYSFDGRFSTTNIRSDRSEIEEELYMQDGWQIQSTKAANTLGGLFTAINQEQYIVTNSRSALLRTIEQEAPPLSSGLSERMVQGTRQGIGWLDTAAIRDILSTSVPALTAKRSALLLPSLQQHMVWSLERQGNLATVRIQPG
jgi:hypothetical protein